MTQKNENQVNEQSADQPIGPPVEPPQEQPFEQPAEKPTEPTDPVHKCSICNGLDHRACGCEAKELAKKEAQGDKDAHFRSTTIKHNHREVPSRAAEELAQTHVDQMYAIHDYLSVINSNLEILVKLQQERAKVLEDIQDGRPN